MPDDDGTCEYVLDPDDPETWGGEVSDDCLVGEDILNGQGVWTCPHDAEENKNLCIFHLPVNKKENREVVDAFLETVTTTDDRTDSGEQKQSRRLLVADSNDSEERMRNRQFIGARFGTFDLSENMSDVVIEGGWIALSHAKFDGKLDWSHSTFDIPSMSLRGVKFADEVVFYSTEFKGETDFTHAEFNDEADFTHAEFAGVAHFTDVEFSGMSFFNLTKFQDDVSFFSAEFENAAQLSAEYEAGALFSEAEFKGEANLSAIEFQGLARFDYTVFRGFTDFHDAEFKKDASFSHAEFEEFANFVGLSFDKGPDFSDIIALRIRFTSADLTDSTFTGASLRNADFESALLNRAILFNVDLRGAKLSGAVLGDVQIDENTQFLGHPSDETGDGASSMLDTLSKLRSGNYCVYDPRYEGENKDEDIDNAKSVYRALEELAGRAARPQLQSTCFVNRQDLQRKQYHENVGESENPLEWAINFGKWIRAKVARTVLLYGESPWRIISWSLAIVLGFALLYPLRGWMQPEGGDPITYSQIVSNPLEFLNSVYYSTLTFTALGFGDFKPVGLGRALTTIETGLGAVLVALLVFVLGRRAAR